MYTPGLNSTFGMSFSSFPMFGSILGEKDDFS